MPKINRTEVARRAGITLERLDELAPTLREYVSNGAYRKAVIDAIRRIEETPRITGLTAADRLPDPESAWARAIEWQDHQEEKQSLRKHQEIILPGDKPCAVAMLSDPHFGSADCDYKRARDDAELIRDTPGMYGMVLGDIGDNWIGSALGYIQREQPMRLVEEQALERGWIRVLVEKLLVFLLGNHDARTVKEAGIDWLALVLEHAACLYDHNETVLTLKLGEASWRMKLRHVWPGRSIYNRVHGQVRDAHFVDPSWDIAVGGHTHAGTLFVDDVPFSGIRKLYVQIGTYKISDAYARRHNMTMAPEEDRGCGALLFYPDGRLQTFRCLRTCAEFLGYLRGA